MKLILNTYNSNETFYGYAFLDLTPALAQLILNRAELLDRFRKTNDGALSEMQYYDNSPIFLSGLPDAIKNNMESGEDQFEVSASAEDFEDLTDELADVGRMVIIPTGVCWTCSPARCPDVAIETVPIAYHRVIKAREVLS